MVRFLCRRIAYAALMALGVSMLVFFLMALLPGDHVRVALAGGRASAEFTESLQRVYGLDVPVMQRYLHWLTDALTGNLGYSFSYGKPVTAMIASTLPVTLTVGLLAFGLELVLGIFLGVLSAWKAGTLPDRLGLLFSLVTISLPPFVLALFLQKWFVLDLKLLPLSGLSTPGVAPSFLDYLRHLVLPCATLALLEAGRLSRYVRASMLATLSTDPIRAARAGGLSTARILFQVALHNALIPVITYIGMSLPVLLGGALVIETVFALPGMGLLAYQAVLARDYPLVMGITLLLCLATIVGNTMADIAYRLADPRIRVGRRATWDS